MAGPTPKQTLFHQAVAHYDEVGFGGARGGGKSHALCREAVRQSLAYPGNMGLIVRRDLVDLRKTTLEVMRKRVLPETVGIEAEWVMSPVITLKVRPKGGLWSEIQFGETKDPISYQSANLGWCGIDEATEVSYEFVKSIRGAIGRHYLPDGSLAPRKLFWASNPGPGWCKSEFPITLNPLGCKRTGEILNEAGEQRQVVRVFIPALPRDNPYLDSFFEAQLRRDNPEVWCRRFLEGSWDAFEGQVFDEFNDDTMIIRERLDLSQAPMTHLFTCDWGFTSPMAALVVSLDFDGVWWVWREYRHSKRTPEEHAPYLRQMIEGLNLTASLMDPAAVDQSSGVTIRQQFTQFGFWFSAYGKRKSGPEGSLMFLKSLMRQNKLRIAQSCAGLVTEIKEARWEKLSDVQAEKHNLPERMIDKDDHSIDALLGAVEWYRQQPIELTVDQREEREIDARLGEAARAAREDKIERLRRRRDDYDRARPDVEPAEEDMAWTL